MARRRTRTRTRASAARRPGLLPWIGVAGALGLGAYLLTRRSAAAAQADALFGLPPEAWSGSTPTRRTTSGTPATPGAVTPPVVTTPTPSPADDTNFDTIILPRESIARLAVVINDSDYRDARGARLIISGYWSAAIANAVRWFYRDLDLPLPAGIDTAVGPGDAAIDGIRATLCRNFTRFNMGSCLVPA